MQSQPQYNSRPQGHGGTVDANVDKRLATSRTCRVIFVNPRIPNRNRLMIIEDARVPKTPNSSMDGKF